ncbi:hypothetical protein H5410_064161 [Solanum commersonii]|uniref:Uncharacterized protein n=1 Tax=Solanum commersonii TaxID=4109 RepID=A0A9J5W0D6_SOLCO|nr:hypothetical protein H5410_064161 [Solanum commersonii]
MHCLFSYSYYSLCSAFIHNEDLMFSSVDVQSNMLHVGLKNCKLMLAAMLGFTIFELTVFWHHKLKTVAWHGTSAMTDFKAFELIRVLAWQSLVSFPLTDHPFSEMTDELPLFLFLLLSLLCFINDEGVEVVFHASSIWMFPSVDVQSNMLHVELKNCCLAWHFRWVYEILGSTKQFNMFFSRVENCCLAWHLRWVYVI